MNKGFIGGLSVRVVAENSNKPAVCLYCQQPCKTVCAACQSERYCSRDCQRMCWSDHRSVCGELKVVRALIMDNKIMEANGMRRSTKTLELLADEIGSKVTIKEPPSRKSNGRLRGKQARCNAAPCASPGAVGVRYQWRESNGEPILNQHVSFKKCVCAHAARQSPLALRHSARRR